MDFMGWEKWFRMLKFCRTASYKIYLIRLSLCLPVCLCLSVRPSVCLWLSFLMIGSLVFSYIVLGDSWRWYLVTDKARFLKKKKRKKKKKKRWPKFGSNRPKSDPKLGFLPYSWVWIFSSPMEIAYNDSLKQFHTRGK